MKELQVTLMMNIVKYLNVISKTISLRKHGNVAALVDSIEPIAA